MLYATSSTAPRTAIPAQGEVVLTRGSHAAAPAGVPSFPGLRFAHVYLDDVLTLQGAEYVAYSPAYADSVKIAFSTVDHARMANAALRDTVLGAKLVYVDPTGTPYDMSKPGAPWSFDPLNAIRNVAGLPGVNGYRWIGEHTVMFTPTSTEARVKLEQLVESRIRDLNVRWKGACSGPGCPPDPAPPTGAAATPAR